MSNLVIPNAFNTVPDHLRGETTDNSVSGGITTGYSIVGYRGKVWAIKHKGKEYPLMRDDPKDPGPRSSIEVVLVQSSQFVSKVFYEKGYTEGSNAPPDCYSSNGIAPEANARNKQHPTCNGCPRNAWGSRITPQGKQAKQCSDSKRLAVVPAQDILNEALGGPMLLRVPAASLQDLGAFHESMKRLGYGNPATYIMRISFDPTQSYPKFVYSPVRPLKQDEYNMVKKIAADPVVVRVLAEGTDAPPASAHASPPADLPEAFKIMKPPVETNGNGRALATPKGNPKPEGAEALPWDKQVKEEQETPLSASLDDEIESLMKKKF